MSQEYPPDQYIESLSNALYETTSREYLQRAVDLQPRQNILDSQSALRKPTSEKLDSSATFWTDFAISTAETNLAEKETPDTDDIFDAYTQAVGVTSSIIDYVKKRTIGLHASTSESNIIIARMLDLTALEAVTRHGTMLSRDKTFVEYPQVVAYKLTQDDRQSVAWKGVKIASFWSMVRSYNGLAAIADGMRCGPESLQEAEQLGVENDALFSVTELMLQYGVKPAIAPSRLQNGNIREWLVQSRKSVEAAHDALIDPDSSHEKSRRRHEAPWIASFVSTDQRFKTSKPDLIKLGTAKHPNLHVTAVNVDSLIEIVDTDKSHPDTMVRLGQDGHLYSGTSVPLRSRVNLTLYEALRADILSVYADLVVPIYIVGLYDQEAEAVKAAPTTSNNRAAGLRTLVLSRERVLRELGQDICAQLDDEREKAERDMIEHDVIGHVRRLPSSYRASQESRDFCRVDLGYELSEFGETYVRDHKRGNVVVETLGHRADLKHVASTAVKAMVATNVSKNASRNRQKRRR